MDYRRLYLKYHFVANLLLLAAIAYFLADGANSLAARAAYFPATGAQVAAAPAQEKSFHKFHFDPALAAERDIFGSAEKQNEAGRGDGTDARPVDFYLILIGVYYYGKGDQDNIATFYDPQTRESGIYFAGDLLPDFSEVMEIKWDRARVKTPDGKLLTVLLSGGQSQITLPPRTSPGEIESLGPDHYLVPRALIEGTLDPANPDSPIQSVRAFRRADGIAIHRIKPGSILSRLGLVNGDVLKSINGNPASDTRIMLDLMRDIRHQSKVVLEIDRQGQALEIVYELK